MNSDGEVRSDASEERPDTRDARTRPPMFSKMDKVDRLKTLIAATTTTEDELIYQVRRLEQLVKSRTEEERQFHAELKAGYEQAAFYVRTLKRYHEGRLSRLLEGEKLEEEEDGSISHGGVAQPFTQP